MTWKKKPSPPCFSIKKQISWHAHFSSELIYSLSEKCKILVRREKYNEKDFFRTFVYDLSNKNFA